MRSSSGRIDFAASAKRIEVDNRLSLRIYFRIADNILRQAYIFRNEKNIIDLYVMLLRFSSLVSETIPRHRDYRASPVSKKNSLKKQLLNALNELEELKPAVSQKIEELDAKQKYQLNGWGQPDSSNSLEWPPKNKNNQSDTLQTLAVAANGTYDNLPTKLQLEDRFRKWSLTRPKEETLSRHSILGPNGLRAQWQPPVRDKGVYYPSNLDVTPVEIPRIQQATEDAVVGKLPNKYESELAGLETSLSQDCAARISQANEPSSMISFEAVETPNTTIVKQPSPPAVLAAVQDLLPSDPPIVKEMQDVRNDPLPDNLVAPESPMELHISTSMMDTFLRLAQSNTSKDLETCGILAGSLKNRKFYITALIIPKQEATANSCQATNEEEIFDVQDKRSLFPLGWIHTHPTQSCFMSSIDVHTHYSYQVMLPEAVAIVMAPTDRSKKHGIFRLTTPGGMSVIRNCDLRGFHAHDPPPCGGPIYAQCTDVYMNPNFKFEVIDLR